MSTVRTRNLLLELEALGQSVWMDSFRRGWIRSGELARLIEEDGITGVTVNPSIFEKAVSGSTDYDEAIRDLYSKGRTTQEMYELLMMEDIRRAADLFRCVYDATEGRDGFVSIELPPVLAYDTEGSIREAQRYHDLVGWENILIKVPGTPEGAPAVEELTYVGVNVNITLLFSIESYEAVARAYIRGLEHRLEDGEPIDRIASVASFFVSRIDTAMDKQLEEKGQTDLFGKSAIANAKLAYQRYKEIFGSMEFHELEDQGARVQRVLWASTSTKNPRYPDTYYVDNLIGSQTVNTLPPHTMFAFKDHGDPHPTLEQNLDEAHETMRRLREIGIDFNAVTQKLQDDGVKAFQKSVDDAVKCLDNKREALDRKAEKRQTAHLGDYQGLVDETLRSLSEQSFSRRIWERDAGLWKQSPDGEKIIKNRLGWMSVVDTMSVEADNIIEFADTI
ncbi:MAG TPA: transaldolase, partial [Armatimonadota bacterium]|nr:transaldolase [Armatimonadota bacterium]